MCLPELCCLVFLRRPWDPELQGNPDLDPQGYSEYCSPPGRWWTSRALSRHPTQLVACYFFSVCFSIVKKLHAARGVWVWWRSAGDTRLENAFQ